MVNYTNVEKVYYNVKNDLRMPWEFQMTNKYDHVIQLRITTPCGCTLVEGGKSMFDLQPGETYDLKGTLTKRSKIGEHKKRVIVLEVDNRDRTKPKTLNSQDLYYTMHIVD